MIIKPIYYTPKKMSYFEYLFSHCVPTGFKSIRYAFYFWIRLLQGDTSDYKFYQEKFGYSDEDLFEMLKTDFWMELEDDVLPKTFLEGLYQQIKDVEDGKIELITYSNLDDLFNDLNDVINNEL